ncbi:MAG: hypothetical protein AAB663_02755 [Patescibacteria group bacterium]
MRKLLTTGLLSLFLFVPYAVGAITVSDTGLKGTADVANYDTTTAGGNIATFIGTYIIQPVLGIVGLIFLVLTLYAGVLWMTSSGNADMVKKAKEILVNSVIGLVIVAAAYAITAAVFNALSSGSISG